MNVTRTGAICSAIVLAALLGGCCCGGGQPEPGTVTVTPASGATVGQQLIELQKAYESGAITEDEYKKLKQEAIDKSKE